MPEWLLKHEKDLSEVAVVTEEVKKCNMYLNGGLSK